MSEIWDNAEFLKIDEDKLDKVCFTHADTYFDFAKALADAREEVNLAKARLDVVEAEAEEEIRKFPRRFKLKEPIREGQIKLKVVLHPAVQKATDRLNKRKAKVGVLEAAVNALEHRKRMIEKAVDLFLANYFSKPKVGEEMDDRRKTRIQNKRQRETEP